MSSRINRRRFLHASAAGGALFGLGLGDLGFLSRLPRVSAAEAKLDTDLVRLDPDIEPTVRLLEDTPRERLLEEVAGRIKAGLSYREVAEVMGLSRATIEAGWTFAKTWLKRELREGAAKD